jgi:hypothetical protein
VLQFDLLDVRLKATKKKMKMMRAKEQIRKQGETSGKSEKVTRKISIKKTTKGEDGRQTQKKHELMVSVSCE